MPAVGAGTGALVSRDRFLDDLFRNLGVGFCTIRLAKRGSQSQPDKNESQKHSEVGHGARNCSAAEAHVDWTKVPLNDKTTSSTRAPEVHFGLFMRWILFVAWWRVNVPQLPRASVGMQLL